MLREVQIEERRGFFAQRDVLAVLQYANDFQIWRVVGTASRGSHLNAFTDWLLSRPVASREGFVDHHDAWRAFTILFAERAAAQQGDAQRFEIPWRDRRRPHLRAFTLLRSVAFDRDRAPRPAQSERQVFGQARRDDSRHRAHAVE